MLRIHPLHAADALQLAAALAAYDNDPGTMELVCRDKWLSAAATEEGFIVL